MATFPSKQPKVEEAEVVEEVKPNKETKKGYAVSVVACTFRSGSISLSPDLNGIYHPKTEEEVALMDYHLGLGNLQMIDIEG